MVFVQELPPEAWILRILCGLIGFVITGSLLHSEIKNRRSPTVHFSSRLLRLTSLGCLWCGPISALSLILSVIPGFCMMRYIGSAMAFMTQFVLMSFYQLSRLHYCFSNQKLHGNKGYPLWMFLVMVAIGVIDWILQMMLYVFVDTLPSKCGYNNDLSVFYRNRMRAILFDGDSWEDDWMNEVFYLWSTAINVLGYMWDVAILLLCIFKIWQISKSLRCKQDGV